MGVVLRPITKEDTPLIVAWRNNERVRTNFVFREVFTEEMHNNWMDTKVATGEVVQFIIETEEEHKPIGSVYIRDITETSGEYGMFIGDDAEVGKGYGRDVVRLTMDYAFKTLGLDHIIIRIFADNPASLRACIAAGFVEYERKDEKVEGEDKTLVFLRLDKDKYEN